ncbi:hypothetical protein [Pseudomonas sp. T1.Ur]|uniref:hypothetical protein n=1 Tax=Pseudomonas sp. T1.Ur TaxID=2928704 RepID=UPI00201DD057|nr:hypothetical protein [Pseudomonas sp. T1.Ur]MCL6704481.1 hypothetical protein [Pseudomonas sp. T1.Ur]
MSGIDTWSPWIAIIVAGGPSLLGFLGFIFTLYLSHRHLDAMMEALKNSRYIYIWGPAWRSRGWIGGCVLVTSIAGMVVWPKASIQFGDVDPVDVKNFPAELKRFLIVKVTVMITAVIWMLIAAVLITFR